MYSRLAQPENRERRITDLKRKLSKARRTGDTDAADKAQAEILFLELDQQIELRAFLLSPNHRRALIEKLQSYDPEDLI